MKGVCSSMILKSVLVILGLFAAISSRSSEAWAYPELIRHNYTNCTSCHVSPTGGGILNAYGRALSGEVLSTWYREGEERFAYAVTPPEWLNLQADYKSV